MGWGHERSMLQFLTKAWIKAQKGNVSISDEIWWEMWIFIWKGSNVKSVEIEFQSCIVFCWVFFLVTRKQKARFAAWITGSQPLGISGNAQWLKPLWLEFHKTVKYNYYINLLLQLARLFPGNVDLQARGTDKYLFGLWISACKNLQLRAGYFLDPPWYILDCCRKLYLQCGKDHLLFEWLERCFKLWTGWVNSNRGLCDVVLS